MQSFVGTFATEPLAALAAGLAVGVVVMGFALYNEARSNRTNDPLAELFDPATLDENLEHIARRSVREARRAANVRSALYGQRAQYARLCEVWEREKRDEAIEEVARVMRAGKGARPEPVRTLKACEPAAETEWEELKLLPPPSPAHRAA